MVKHYPANRWHAKPQDSKLVKAGERLGATALAAERAGAPIDDAWLDDLPDAEDVALLPEGKDEVLAQVVKK